jgi:hypothetical protein
LYDVNIFAACLLNFLFIKDFAGGGTLDFRVKFNIYKFKYLGFYIQPLIQEEISQTKIQRTQEQKLPTMLNVVTKRVIPISQKSVYSINIRS